MKGVILDYQTLGPADIDITSITDLLDDWVVYDVTDPDQTLERIVGADVVVVNKVLLTREILNAAKKLKLIAVAATGTNNIDLPAASEKGIGVCNVTGYGTNTVVQHTLMLMLALAGNLIPYTQDVKNGTWAKSDMFCLMNHSIVELDGKVLGIIGYGELGQRLEKLANALGMKVKIAVRPGQPVAGKRVSLEELLPEVDFLSVHCLLSEETRNLIDDAAIRCMKSSAYIINTARGGIVNEQAVYTALVEKRLAGAAFDVLTEEPPAASNILLPSAPLPNLIVTPHCAWASREARQRLVDQVAENITAYQSGTARNIVNA